MIRGLFLVFEGGEGSGKSTQAKLLAEWLSWEGYPVLITKEPGGDEDICRDIRQVLLNPVYLGKFSDRAEFLLFEAGRAQHVDMIIRPALCSGKIVISDRYQAGTFAYQVAARGACSESDFDYVNYLATMGLDPDFTFLIDIDPEIGLERSKAAGKRDRFELENIQFHRKVNEGFRKFCDPADGNCRVLDGKKSIEELHDEVIKILDLHPKLREHLKSLATIPPD